MLSKVKWDEISLRLFPSAKNRARERCFRRTIAKRKWTSAFTIGAKASFCCVLRYVYISYFCWPSIFFSWTMKLSFIPNMMHDHLLCSIATIFCRKWWSNSVCGQNEVGGAKGLQFSVFIADTIVYFSQVSIRYSRKYIAMRITVASYSRPD